MGIVGLDQTHHPMPQEGTVSGSQCEKVKDQMRGSWLFGSEGVIVPKHERQPSGRTVGDVVPGCDVIEEITQRVEIWRLMGKSEGSMEVSVHFFFAGPGT